MKHRILSLLCAGILFIGAVGCTSEKEQTDRETKDIHQYDMIKLFDYLKGQKLHDDLAISFRTRDVSTKTSAVIYEAQYWDFDLSQIQTMLSTVAVTSSAEDLNSNLEGQSNLPQELLLLDHPATSVETQETKGGFEYRCHLVSGFPLDNHYGLIYQDILDGNNLQGDSIAAAPLQWSNLSFMPYETALSNVSQKLEELEFPTMKSKE